MSGCVTVTGPPASICALNFGTTEPLEARTLPKRTEMSRIGDIDRAEHVGLDAFVPILLEHRHVLERSRMKNDIRLELRNEADDPLAVADVGDPAQNFGRALLRL